MDTLANMLTIIRNGGAQGKATVYVPYSNMKAAIARKLFDQGYIDAYAHKKRKKGGDLLEINLRYLNGMSRITEAQRVSKLSRRLYTGVKDLKPIRQGSGMVILSTPHGILTDAEAREHNVGGEILFTIW